MAAVLVFIALLIAYVSFYPFEFAMPAEIRLLPWLDTPTSRGDILANVLLFVPYGFTVALADGGRRYRLALVIAGTILAIALQWVQQFTPARVPALYDAVLNFLGIGFGLLSGLVVSKPRFLILIRGGFWRVATPAEILIAGCWLGNRLFPFVPSLDFEQIKDKLKPLLLDPELSLLASLNNTACWALFFLLLSPGFQRPSLAVFLLAPLTLMLEVLMVDNVLTLANVLGAGMAVLLVVVTPSPFQLRVMIPLLLATILFDGLTPFALAPAPNDFSWMPLSGFFSGSITFNIHSLLRKLFLYGGLVLMLNRSGLGLYPAALAASSWLFLIECAQVFLRHHSPEITDPLIPLLAVFAFRALSGSPTRVGLRRDSMF